MATVGVETMYRVGLAERAANDRAIQRNDITKPRSATIV